MMKIWERAWKGQEGTDVSFDKYYNWLPSKRLNPKTSQENKPEEKIKRLNVKAIDFFQGRKKSSLKISYNQKRAKKAKSFSKKSIKRLIQEMRKLLE